MISARNFVFPRKNDYCNLIPNSINKQRNSSGFQPKTEKSPLVNYHNISQWWKMQYLKARI